MKSLFVMDPLHRINVAGDSTYVVMRECTDRGFPVWWCTPAELYARDGVSGARATPVQVTASAPFFHQGAPESRPLGDFDVVWMRKDPPIDLQYIFTTYLLDMAPPSTLVLNGPAGLSRFNEKLWATTFPELHPPTLVSRNSGQIRAWVEAQPGRAVLKPWDGMGGRGVVVTRPGDRNLGALIELLTDEGRQNLVAQAYVEAISEGDKRILLFEGEPVGAVNRIPTEKDHRGNMHVGARVETMVLSERDVEICRVLAPHLKKHDMVFVGIDVIGTWLTEINHTSPTGIREINRLYGVKLEADLVDCVERRVARTLEGA
jgi:glutathione synthase